MLFICRSGGRSHNAAMMALQAGYSEAYNVLEGFEAIRIPLDTATPKADGARPVCRGRKAEAKPVAPIFSPARRASGIPQR